MGFLESMGRGWCEARDLHERERAQAGRPSAPRPAAAGGADSDRVGPDHATLGDELIAAEQKIMALIAERDAALASAESEKYRAELFGKMLLLPGVREYLVKAFHRDQHPQASAEDKRDFDGVMQGINQGYELLKGRVS
jgi:hypothetical protein